MTGESISSVSCSRSYLSAATVNSSSSPARRKAVHHSSSKHLVSHGGPRSACTEFGTPIASVCAFMSSQDLEGFTAASPSAKGMGLYAAGGPKFVKPLSSSEGDSAPSDHPHFRKFQQQLRQIAPSSFRVAKLSSEGDSAPAVDEPHFKKFQQQVRHGAKDGFRKVTYSQFRRPPSQEQFAAQRPTRPSQCEADGCRKPVTKHCFMGCKRHLCDSCCPNKVLCTRCKDARSESSASSRVRKKQRRERQAFKPCNTCHAATSHFDIKCLLCQSPLHANCAVQGTCSKCLQQCPQCDKKLSMSKQHPRCGRCRKHCHTELPLK